MRISRFGAILGVLVISALTAPCVSSAVDTVSPDLIFKSIERTVDVSSQLVKITAKLTLENVGAAPLKTFLLAAESRDAPKLAFVGARDAAGRELRLAPTTVVDLGAAGDKFWRAELRETLAGGATQLVTVEYVYSEALVPHPTEIAQHEHQLVRYSGNLYSYTPYRVVSQRTVLALGTKSVESFTKSKPFSQADTSVTYGPHKNVAPLSTDELTAHYRNDAPFLRVTRLERHIEVSHWGNVAVEERVELEHVGARLKGAFSRYDYQQEAGSGPASVRSYRTLLPAAATDVYYRDSNGNISTSALRSRRDAVELELRPRYPLFGGWRSHYTLGYNVPSYEHLFRSASDADRYLLRVRALDHVHDDMHVAELVTRVVLPEGARDIALTAPYAVTRQPDELLHTYLDTSGRPVVSFTARNLVEQHIAELQLRYTWPRVLLLREPLLLVAFLFALFLLVLVYVRLDFSIRKDQARKDQ